MTPPNRLLEITWVLRFKVLKESRRGEQPAVGHTYYFATFNKTTIENQWDKYHINNQGYIQGFIIMNSYINTQSVMVICISIVHCTL